MLIETESKLINWGENDKKKERESKPRLWWFWILLKAQQIFYTEKLLFIQLLPSLPLSFLESIPDVLFHVCSNVNVEIEKVSKQWASERERVKCSWYKKVNCRPVEFGGEWKSGEPKWDHAQCGISKNCILAFFLQFSFIIGIFL